MVAKAHEIITSKTAYSSMLLNSINAFYRAMKERSDLKARIEALEKGLAGTPKDENTEKKGPIIHYHGQPIKKFQTS